APRLSGRRRARPVHGGPGARRRLHARSGSAAMSDIDLDRDHQPTDVDYRTREASIDISSLPSTDSELLTINFGPHHPATHGVLRLLVTLEGEVVRDLKP